MTATAPSGAGVPDVLKKILATKVEEIAAAAERTPLREIAGQAANTDAPRGFADALDKHRQDGRAGVIAEIKKASPSKGVIRADFDPAAIARSYSAGGASALSVLTDREYFQGHDDYLVSARQASGLPVLRKDFMVDEYQIYESRAIGADCILLIVAALGDAQLRELYGLALHLEMDALIEVHDGEELERALVLEPRLLGINNRDLRTFETSLDTTLNLLESVPDTCLLVTESAIHTNEDVQLMRRHGVDHFLVGEAFMRADNPGQKLAELFDL
ncbi:MAG: indole-3-glycerol phosphate synthase TrpC [Pseudomonadota bacterium]